MAAHTRTSRETWIEQGLRALARGGPDAVRVELLARSLGVTKGGFYGHFADRGALVEAMLDAWEWASTDDVLRQVEAGGHDARVRLREAGALTFSADRLLPIDLAVRDWARRDADVAARLRRVDNRRMEYLRTLFHEIHPNADDDDVEARCLLAFALLIGSHFTHADHGARTRAAIVERATSILETPIWRTAE